MTVKQAASRLGCSPKTVHLLCAQRKLAHSRIGGGGRLIYIGDSDLEDYLQRTRIGVAKPRSTAPAICKRKTVAEAEASIARTIAEARRLMA